MSISIRTMTQKSCGAWLRLSKIFVKSLSFVATSVLCYLSTFIFILFPVDFRCRWSKFRLLGHIPSILSNFHLGAINWSIFKASSIIHIMETFRANFINRVCSFLKYVMSEILFSSPFILCTGTAGNEYVQLDISLPNGCVMDHTVNVVQLVSDSIVQTDQTVGALLLSLRGLGS